MNREKALELLHAGKMVKLLNLPTYFYYDRLGTLRSAEFNSERHTKERVTALQDREYCLYVPKEEKKETVRFWQTLDRQGFNKLLFYTSDFKHVWDGRCKVVNNLDTMNWIKTQNYIDVEVEIE